MDLLVPNTVKRCLVGIWLSFLYIICVILVVFSLSTCLFQMKLNSLVKQSIGSGSPLIDHYCDTSQIREDNPASGALKIVPCIPAHTIEKENKFTSAEILVHFKRMEQLKRDYYDAYPQWEEAKKSFAILIREEDGADNARKIDLAIAKEVLRQNIQRSETIFETFKKESEGQLSSIFIEIDHFEKFFKHISWILGGVEYYWAFPQPILKIVLVFSMGILGSLIFVTIEFIKEPRGQLNQRFNMYFFRPFLGMIVALAMYVMVKSSLSSFVDNNAEDLSPFLISFLGIVSGMLSEQAYRRIESTGKDMLSTNENKDNKKQASE